MKKIVIIDHFSQIPGEPGNNRFIYLADMLCNQGYQVEIITTTFAHKTKTQRIVSKDMFCESSYKYTMLPEPGYPKNVCLKRFYSHYVFGKNLKQYLDSIEKPDLILIAVPSLDVGSVAANYCKKNNVPLIVDIQDVWPEAFKLVLNIPLISDVIFLPMTLQANKFYAQANKIVAVSETYKNRGIRNNKKDKRGLCVYLGTDIMQFDENRKPFFIHKPDNEVWVTYVGTLGHSYNIEIIIDALNQLPVELTSNIVFNVFGDGPYMNRFQEYAKHSEVSVRFWGRRGYAEMTAYLCESDIAVNPIVKGAAQSIINKHADYAAAGLPVVNTQECTEYRSLINEYKCGINCDVESITQVMEALKQLIEDSNMRKQMGKNSRKMAMEKFDRAHTYQKIVYEIEELTR